MATYRPSTKIDTKLGIVKLHDKHIRDRYCVDTYNEATSGFGNLLTYTQVAAGTGTHVYDNTTATFTQDLVNGNFTQTNRSNKILIPVEIKTYESPVNAYVKTIDFIADNNIAMNGTNNYMHVKIQPTIEDTIKMFTFSNGTTIKQSYNSTEINGYIDNSEINAETVLLNGSKNYISMDFPMSTSVGKSFAIEVDATSELRIFDIRFDMLSRNDKGGIG